MMIEKIASHLADFSPRLMSNTRALYQFCPIPVIDYPQVVISLELNIESFVVRLNCYRNFIILARIRTVLQYFLLASSL